MHFLQPNIKLLEAVVQEQDENNERITTSMVRWKRSSPATAGSDHDKATTKTSPSTVTTTGSTTSSSPTKKQEEGVWETMYESLKRYRKEHGNCKADKDASDSELGQWVMSQRRHYVAYAASTSKGGGDKKYKYTTSCMTQERVDKLKALGLDLSAAAAAGAPAPKAATTTPSTAVKVEEEEEDTREGAPTTTTTTTTTTVSPVPVVVSTPSKRKKIKGEDDEQLHSEPRRPPKKRKKSPPPLQRRVSLEKAVVPAEERDASPQEADVRTTSVDRDVTSSERDGVSPLLEKPVKGRGDSAWETLMNVAALVPPLPTPATAPTTTVNTIINNSLKKPAPALVAASPGSATGSPQQQQQTKRVKSKYGDLEALSNAGCSYSSKYRAANNDVVPNQQRWEDMFLRLRMFKEKNGHCRVPNRYPEDPSLGSWVATQRRYYKNKNLPMPEDRVRRLTELGFEWTTKDPRKVPWETRFEGLKAFKDKFGHVDVPHEWEECPQLGFWTANMRQQYRYKQLGKKSSLTDERIELLNSIGFVWKMQGGRRKKSDPVARPNQNSPSPPPPQALPQLEVSVGVPPPPPPLASAGPMRPLLVDPMSSMRMAAMGGVAGVAAAAYIPPPNVPGMKQRPPHPMTYYSHV